MATPNIEMMGEEAKMRLLEKDAELSMQQQEAARAFEVERQAMADAKESSQRLLDEQEEKARLAEIERQEQQAGRVSEGIADETLDVDTGVADMFSALAYGTDAKSEEASEERKKPKARVRPK